MTAQSSTSLNYRSIQAVSEEDQFRSITITVPLKDINSEFIEVRLQDSFRAESRGKKLSPDRLRLTTFKKNYHLNTGKIKIPVDELIKADDKNHVLLESTIKVEPNDFPGKYHNQLIISYTDSEGKVSEKKFPIKFSIEPWLKLDFDSYFHRITEINSREGYLGSTIPGRIIISGNVPWQLLVKSDKNKNFSNSELILGASSEDERIELTNENINLRKQKNILASSNLNSSKTDKDFIITFDLRIKDFKQIKAGLLELPISFELVPLN